MRFIRHILKALPLVLIALLVTAGVAASAPTKNVQPFIYTFRITSITATGTFTAGDATTTTRIHLSAPTRKLHMTWRGRRDAGLNNGTGGTSVLFVGDATHTSASLPSCDRTMKVTSRGVTPLAFLALGGARDNVTPPTVFVRVGKFPLVTGYPAQDGVCGKVARDWWDVASRIYPLRILKQKGFTHRIHLRVSDEGETMDWTLQMKIRRVGFRRMSCAVAKGC